MTDVETKKPSVVEESSQYQHWRFSPQQLWDIRNERTIEAIDRVKRNMKEEMVYIKKSFLKQNIDSPRLTLGFERRSTTR